MSISGQRPSRLKPDRKACARRRHGTLCGVILTANSAAQSGTAGVPRRRRHGSRPHLNRLAKLQVKPAASMAGYSREKFGPAWDDVDHNGCDIRDDILQRDLHPFEFKAGDDCVIVSGIPPRVFPG